jgi:hypothetical protein
MQKILLSRAFELIAIAAVVIGMAGFLGAGRVKATSNFIQFDTVVWYCAGEAMNEHANPYLVEPLRSCEKRLEPKYSWPSPWLEPAPLPGYALAVIAVLAHLPFHVFRLLWSYLLIAAIIATAVILAKMARRSTLLVLLCLAMVDGYINLIYGETPPLAVAALVASAALGASQRFTAAAIVGALAMFEPHIGLPACLSMFIWWPRTRVPFLVCGAVLAGISIAAIGVAGNIQYFHTVLPLQAASEIAARDQYSLTRVLHILGFPDRLALSAGSVSYVVMTILGVAVARRLAVSIDSPGLVALQPPAMAMLGGLYVHDLLMAAAIPAAVLLAASARFPLLLRTAALVGIVFPWPHWNTAIARGQIGMLEIATVAGAVLVGIGDKPIKVRVAGACAGVFAVVVLASLIHLVPQHRVGPPTIVARPAIGPGDISSSNWAGFVSRDVAYSTPDLRDMFEKVPTWLGLIAVAGMGIQKAGIRIRVDRRSFNWFNTKRRSRLGDTAS